MRNSTFVLALALIVCPLWAEPGPADARPASGPTAVPEASATNPAGTATNPPATVTPETAPPAADPVPDAREQALARLSAPARELFERAEEHFFRGRHNVAQKLFLRVLEQAPECGLAYRYSGEIYLIKNDTARALEQFDIARELTVDPEQDWLRLGQAQYLAGKADLAEAAFTEALRLKPDLAICRFYLGLVSFRLRRDRDATIAHWEAYRVAAPLDPQGPAIDRALEYLKRPDFAFPPEEAAATTPAGSDTRVPYMPGENADEKRKNEGEGIIEIDDL